MSRPSFATLAAGAALAAACTATFAVPARAQQKTPVYTPGALTPGFVSCTSTRQSSLNTALSSAQTYSTNALAYLTAGTVSARTKSRTYSPSSPPQLPYSCWTETTSAVSPSVRATAV